MSLQSSSSFESGVTALREGRAEEAKQHFRDDLKGRPDHAPTLYNLGVLEYQSGNAEHAERLLLQAVEVRPDHVDTRSILAAVFVDLKKLEPAVTQARVVAQSPDAHAAALNTVGQVLALAGLSAEAEAVYVRVLGMDEMYRPSVKALVELLMGRRAFTKARDICNKFLAGHPTDQDIHLKRAQALWEGGEIAAARNALLDLLDFAPDHITAHHNLALFADQPDPLATMDRLVSLLGEGRLDDSNQVKAWFTLGNLSASTGAQEEALACFSEGNRLRASHATAVHATSIAAFNRRVASVTSSPLPSIAKVAPSRCTPLVITGPSRSGKTLLQSLLSAHPDITVADEVGLLPKLAEMDVSSDPARREEAAKQYRSTLAALAGDARYIIDTHPTNALYLDLLLQLCPDAKIIQMRRDPLDLAVSIFARNFVTGGHWADTWQGIAARIKNYDRLQAYYAPWAPVVSTVQYDELVIDPQPVLSQIVEGLGLDNAVSAMPPSPEDAQSALRPMPWASFTDRQAPRPDSVRLWKPFAAWLGAFAEAYGRADLDGVDAIPEAENLPHSSVVIALRSFRAGQTIATDSKPTLENVPAYHAALAHEAEEKGRWREAVDARWRAVSCRPFTHYVRDHAEALDQTIALAPDHQELSQLHRDVSSRWAMYRQSSNMPFGDFGLLYQSFEPAKIVGSRNTEERIAVYGLEELCSEKRVLDLGCNTGFLAVAVAPHASNVVGIEQEQTLVDIGSLVQTFVGADNVSLQHGDATTFHSDQPFDVVIAAAVHGWMSMPLAALGQRLADLTAEGGAVLFESQGQRSTTVIEEGFHEKIIELTKAGFDIERRGTICDDRVNMRAFVILRKRS